MKFLFALLFSCLVNMLLVDGRRLMNSVVNSAGRKCTINEITSRSVDDFCSELSEIMDFRTQMSEIKKSLAEISSTLDVLSVAASTTTAVDPCPGWCKSSGLPWTQKCTWRACGVCFSCADLEPDTNAPTFEPTNRLLTNAPTSEPTKREISERCASWCWWNNYPWSVKCFDFVACTGCNPCRSIDTRRPTLEPTGPVVEETDEPTLEPTDSTDEPTVEPTKETSQPLRCESWCRWNPVAWNGGKCDYLACNGCQQCTLKPTQDPTQPSAEGECFDWCPRSPVAWDEGKCDWSQCRGCAPCHQDGSDSGGPAPTMEPTVPGECAGWCWTSPVPWDEGKCRWLKCKACGRCRATTMLETDEPTREPTIKETDEPTFEPTKEPTVQETDEPTFEPTREPTAQDTDEPTFEPTREPTVQETDEPTREPTAQDTDEPTREPTNRIGDTAQETDEPTFEPTREPTVQETDEPTFEPTKEPTTTSEPTLEPTKEPTLKPTSDPTTEDCTRNVQLVATNFKCEGALYKGSPKSTGLEACGPMALETCTSQYSIEECSEVYFSFRDNACIFSTAENCVTDSGIGVATTTAWNIYTYNCDDGTTNNDEASTAVPESTTEPEVVLQCQGWCARRTQLPWTQKCTFAGCNGCEQCPS